MIVSWLCSSGFLWLFSGEFRGCASMGVCGCALVSFVVVRSDLWASGVTAVVDLWWGDDVVVCGGATAVVVSWL